MLKRTTMAGILVLGGCYEGLDRDSRGLGPGDRSLDGGSAILGVHFAYDDDDAAQGHADVLQMFDGKPGHTVELAYAEGQPESWLPGRREKIRSIADAGFEVILRIDYRGHYNVPPPEELETYVDFFVNEMVVPLKDDVRIFVVGNEPNLDIECDEGAHIEHCEPAHYAEVYRAVRDAVHEHHPGAVVLIAGLSPGAAQGARWKSSDDYWNELLAELDPSEVDGFALHAYGGGDRANSIAMFSGDLEHQLDLISGHGSKPTYVTEFNRRSNGPDDEPTSALFLQDAYAWMEGWNAGAGNTPKISAGCWYVYKHRSGESGYSLRDQKSDGGTPDTDVWHAFAAVASGEAGQPDQDSPSEGVHPIHRAYSHQATDHFYTTDREEIEAAGYTLEHEDYFWLRDDDDDDTVPLWRCWSAQESDHFYTTSGSCEDAPDMVLEGNIGFIATTQLPGAVPLLRLYKSGDHFYTVSAAEAESAQAAHGYTFEKVVGYVWPTDQ